jgi:iron(III) transport system permease protein
LTTTLPQLRPAIAAGGLLSALYAVGDFGVPALLRYDSLTRAIYVQYRTGFDRGAAATLSLLLVIFASLLLLLESRARGQATLYRLGSGAAKRARPVPLGRWRLPALAFCVAVTGLALGLPLAVLGYWLGRAINRGAALPELFDATLHSLTLGGLVALAATAAALPVAIFSVRYGGGRIHRQNRGIAKPWRRLAMVVERLCLLGYALPGIVVALAFVALGVHSPFHQSLLLLVVACTARFLPEVLGASRVSLLQVNPRQEEAARSLGRSPLQAVLNVTIPLARSGVLAGAALVVLTTMKELPTTLLLSPTGWDTLATEIWNASTEAAYGRAAAPALLLIVLSALPMLMLVSSDRTRSV